MHIFTEPVTIDKFLYLMKNTYIDESLNFYLTSGTTLCSPKLDKQTIFNQISQFLTVKILCYMVLDIRT